MTNITSTKKDIIAEILNIADFLKKEKLFSFTRGTWSLNQDKKDMLIVLRNGLLNVIIENTVRAGKGGGVPELKEVSDEYAKNYESLKAELTAVREHAKEDIAALLKEWLGSDLTYNVNGSIISVIVPGIGEHSHNLTIDIQYKEKYFWGHEDSTIEINQPTFGPWNPRQIDVINPCRFFKAMNDICNESGLKHLDILKSLMDETQEKIDRFCSKIDALNEEYNTKATEIIKPIVYAMEF